QNTVTREPDGLAIAALDSRAAAPSLEEAQAKGIPVVAFDSGVESDIPVSTVATDNAAAAREAGKHMVELVGGEGKVAVVAHDQVSQSGTDRRDGFIAGIEEFGPDIELLPVQYGEGDQAKSADIARSMISANPDLKGLFGTNEGSAIGVLRGVQESGRHDLAVVGFDSGRAQVEAISEGEMAGGVTQNPVAMGRITVQTVLATIRGEETEPTIDTGFFWYDSDNIDSDEIQEAIYLWSAGVRAQDGFGWGAPPERLIMNSPGTACPRAGPARGTVARGTASPPRCSTASTADAGHPAWSRAARTDHRAGRRAHRPPGPSCSPTGGSPRRGAARYR